MKRRGVELRLVLEGDSGPGRIDLPMLRAVARARRWSDELISGQARSVDGIARRERLDRRSVRRLLSLGFLSPRVVEAIVEGRQPPDLSVMADPADRSALAMERPGTNTRPRMSRTLVLEIFHDFGLTTC
jgi:hypothetical protein